MEHFGTQWNTSHGNPRPNAPTIHYHDAVTIEIVEQSADSLREYGKIPISFTVDSRYRVEAIDRGLGGWRLTEERVAPPYVNDYDDEVEERPLRWSRRWDMSNWVFLAAVDGGEWIGAAAVARDTPGAHMLEGRTDLAVLWDIRVHPDRRREGIGSRLFRHAAEWARASGCRYLKIETQNINVRACRFYASQGCHLRGIHHGVYKDNPDEVQLLWYLRL